MTIAKDLSQMSKRWDPDPEPRFVALMAQAWLKEIRSEEARPRAIPAAGPYRASFASVRCDRALWWDMHDRPPSDPFSVADVWRMELGKMVHRELGELLAGALGQDHEVVLELGVDLRPVGFPGSASVDYLIKDRRTDRLAVYSLELKTMGGFQFKRKTVGYQGGTAGPRYDHVLQASLAGMATGADEAIVGYLALENFSVKEAKRLGLSELQRFSATWTISRDLMEQVVAHESKRVLHVLAHPEVPLPLIFDPEVATLDVAGEFEAEIIPPASGSVSLFFRDHDDDGNPSRTEVSRSSTWQCGYCPHRSSCERLHRTGSPDPVEAVL